MMPMTTSLIDETQLYQCSNSADRNGYNPFYSHADPVHSFTYNTMTRQRLDEQVSVKLEDGDLWHRFHNLGTEMIITKNGRRLFPNYRISISGLNPETKYMLLFDIVPVDDNRYKYHESQWIVSGKAEPHIYGRYYIHPEGPQTGLQWMKQTITFNKVKVTNNPIHANNQILLNSMHRYLPRVHIVEASDNYAIRTGPLSTFTFDETTFIAVTAYQNEKITKLKINNNPFAKGFRETTQTKKATSSKPVKRLQTNAPLMKKSKSNEDSSLHSAASDSPPLPTMLPTEMSINTPNIYDSMTPFTPVYHPSYSYMTANPSPIHFNPYGYYANNVYSANPYQPTFF